MPIRLHDPVADRLPGRLELSGKIIRITAGADQINHPTAESGNYGGRDLGFGKPPGQALGAPPNRVNFRKCREGGLLPVGLWLIDEASGHSAVALEGRERARQFGTINSIIAALRGRESGRYCLV
jgi:hypothetical protein